MLSVATLVVIIAGIGWLEGYNGIRRSSDEFVLVSSLLTIFLSTVLGAVGCLWSFGAFGWEPAPYLLPSFNQIVERFIQ